MSFWNKSTSVRYIWIQRTHSENMPPVKQSGYSTAPSFQLWFYERRFWKASVCSCCLDTKLNAALSHLWHNVRFSSFILQVYARRLDGYLPRIFKQYFLWLWKPNRFVPFFSIWDPSAPAALHPFRGTTIRWLHILTQTFNATNESELRCIYYYTLTSLFNFLINVTDLRYICKQALLWW